MRTYLIGLPACGLPMTPEAETSGSLRREEKPIRPGARVGEEMESIRAGRAHRGVSPESEEVERFVLEVERRACAITPTLRAIMERADATVEVRWGLNE